MRITAQHSSIRSVVEIVLGHGRHLLDAKEALVAVDFGPFQRNLHRRHHEVRLVVREANDRNPAHRGLELGHRAVLELLIAGVETGRAVKIRRALVSALDRFASRFRGGEQLREHVVLCHGIELLHALDRNARILGRGLQLRKRL